MKPSNHRTIRLLSSDVNAPDNTTSGAKCPTGGRSAASLSKETETIPRSFYRFDWGQITQHHLVKQIHGFCHACFELLLVSLGPRSDAGCMCVVTLKNRIQANADGSNGGDLLPYMIHCTWSEEGPEELHQPARFWGVLWTQKTKKARWCWTLVFDCYFKFKRLYQRDQRSGHA